MKEFKSKSSISVKILTIGLTIVLALVSISLIIGSNKDGLISGLILATVTATALIYFFINSLKKIIVTNKELILKKQIGQIVIPLDKIIEIKSINHTALSLTSGSKGYFGYIGNTMDNSISLVKDRSKMLLLKTSNKKYLFNCDRPSEIISAVNTLL